jgi:hypothetical protein
MDAKVRERARTHGENTSIIGRQHDSDIEDQQISGDTAAAPVFPLDIILRRLELLCFSGQVCRFLQGDANCRRLEF